jgi:hypothetical protein
MDIYWTHFPIITQHGKFLELGALGQEPPSKLIQNIPEKLRVGNYPRCPAFNRHLKNLFVIKSPLDAKITLDIEKKEIYVSESRVEWYQHYLDANQLENDNTIQFKTQLLFFSEKSVEMMIMHPFMHHNVFTDRGSVLMGSFDISKWFRPLNAAYFIKDDFIKENNGKLVFDIKQDDVLAYVKFHTDENINFIYSMCTPKIEDIAQMCDNHKYTRNKTFSLQESYHRFKQFNLGRQLIKEFKRST